MPKLFTLNIAPGNVQHSCQTKPKGVYASDVCDINRQRQVGGGNRRNDGQARLRSKEESYTAAIIVRAHFRMTDGRLRKFKFHETDFNKVGVVRRM